MALKNQAITVCYVAWNTSTNAGQTGDAANHTLKLVQDGSENPPTNAPAQVDSVNAPGVYSLALTAGDMNFNCVVLCGKSSTANVSIIPLVIVTERGVLPSTAPGSANGVLIAGSNVATTIAGLTLAGANATGPVAATAGLSITGGTGSTSVGGFAGAGVSITGGAGASGTNPAAAGIALAAGTSHFSGGGADGVIFAGSGNGNGLTLTHAGTGFDLNAQTTNALQVNVTAVNAVSASSVTTINANVGTTQPVNFSGTGASALVKTQVGGYASGQDPATLVLDVAIAGHETAGTVGAAIAAAGGSGDPWATALPGSYTSGQAGYIIGHQLEGTFTTASSSVFSSAALANAPTGGSAPTAAQVATAVWQDLTSSSDFTTTGSIGKLLATDIDAAISSRSTFSGGAVASVTGNVGGDVLGSVASVTAAVVIDQTQILGSPRALDAIADGSMKISDALWSAVGAGVGQKDASSGTSETIKTPSTATLLRTYTLTTAAWPPTSSVTKAV